MFDMPLLVKALLNPSIKGGGGGRRLNREEGGGLFQTINQLGYIYGNKMDFLMLVRFSNTFPRKSKNKSKCDRLITLNT